MTREAWKNTVGRRELLRSLAAFSLTVACTPETRPITAPDPVKQPLSRPPVELWSWFDLPDDPRSRELSGIAWDEKGRRLWAVPDRRPQIVSLLPSADFKAWTFGETVPVQVDGPLDLEGIVFLGDGFVVSSEKGPRILELDLQGKLRREIEFPGRMSEALKNKSLESLSLSPDRRFVFTANEVALPRDGAAASATRGTHVRILRCERGTNAITEYAYETDPADRDGGDWGVADLAALSNDDVLVLERGWAKGAGNAVRVYRVDLTETSASCTTADAIASTPSLTKKLFVDIARLPAAGLPHMKQPQASALLDNYEGIALGPRLPDGRRAIFLVSDDNGRADQFARVLVLAVTGL